MNPFFAYLIKCSVSLALLYCLFRITVRNSGNHALNRYLLLGTLFLAAVIPLLNVQIFYKEVQIAPVEFVREFITNPSQGEVVLPENTIEAPEAIQSTTINYWYVSYLALAGIIFVRFLVGFLQVSKIIKRAKKQTYRKVILAVVKDFIQPFSFLNKVVLSEKDYNENKDIVVAHEYAHIKYLHAADLMICELFTIVQFFNPFMWLLRRDLKLIHEYQADKAVLNKGIDAQKYQLLVLEKAVGERRFAMANHFTQKPILKRLNMMNKNKIDKWAAVKIILFVPIVAVLLQAFARPQLITKSEDFIPVRYTENETEKWLSKWTVDNIGKGIFEPGIKVNEHKNSANNFLVILMNSKDQYLIENEIAAKSEIKRIASNYLHGKNPDGKQGPDFVEKEIAGIGKVKVCNGLISYRHDVASSKEAINYTLRQIGEAYLEARQKKAQVLFNADYFELNEEKLLAVNEVVPVWFAYEHPKGPKPSVWLPFDGKASPDSKPFNIIMKSHDEIYVENHKFSSMEEFYESIKKWDKELKSVNQRGNRVKKFYQANLIVDYAMSEAVWNKLQLALYRNNIGINKFKKKSGYKVIAMSVNEKKTSRQRYKVPAATDNRDKSKLYVALYNDEEVDLTEIKSTALECLETKKTAIIEFEEGVEKRDIESVRKVLKKCGISDINVTSMEKNVPQPSINVNEPKTINKTAVNPQKRLPWIRFSENLIFVNGKECELSEMNNILKQILENEEQAKVELMIFPNSSNARVSQLTAELNKMRDLEIVQKQYTPPPHPLAYKLYLYPDKIKVNRKVISLENVAQLTKEWIEVTGIKKAEIHMPEAVNEERIAALQQELKKGGIE